MANKRKHYGGTVRTSVILSEETHSELKAMATKDRTMSDIISQAVTDFLSERQAPVVSRRVGYRVSSKGSS